MHKRAVQIIVQSRSRLHVRYWHLADMQNASENVRFRG